MRLELKEEFITRDGRQCETIQGMGSVLFFFWRYACVEHE